MKTFEQFLNESEMKTYSFEEIEKAVAVAEELLNKALDSIHGEDRLKTTLELTKGGKKYNRIVKKTGNSRAAWGFVDNQGNIYKAASWASPTKGVRGTISDFSDPKKMREHVYSI